MRVFFENHCCDKIMAQCTQSFRICAIDDATQQIVKTESTTVHVALV